MGSSETEALASFLRVVNEVIRGNQSPMSEKTALKFLIARKFDVGRAIELYQKHEVVRLREGLSDLDPANDELKTELSSGKFTILRQRSFDDAAIAIFTARLHAPIKSKNTAIFKSAHKYTLQNIVYQLDSALEDTITQRNGIVFIYNMSESDYSNFDYELCQKILNLLKGAYPARLKKVLIVSPPLWFRAPYHVLRLIAKEKLQKRVELVNIEQLKNHLPETALTADLGGTCIHDHGAWIQDCELTHRVEVQDLCDTVSAQTLVDRLAQKGSSIRRPSLEDPRAMISSESNNYLSGKCSNIYDYDSTNGLSLNLFLDHIRERGPRGLGDEYDDIVKSESSGTFLVSTNPTNINKNRYINVVCYDHSRVVLEPYDLQEGASPSDPSDYINASYVDGYRQPRGYISTQGPIPNTIIDFWRMIWQTECRVIVMVTLVVENFVPKCDKYWPSSEQRVMILGRYKVEYVDTDKHEDFIVTNLRLTSTKSEESRNISHIQFISWPDFGVPKKASALLQFREFVLKKQLDALGQCRHANPPITVHCSAGIGRSGTFITLDICLQRFETTGLVDVRHAVSLLRQQRYSSIQTRDQYVFCYRAVVEYAASRGLLDQDVDPFKT